MNEDRGKTVDYRRLMKKVEWAVAAIERTPDVGDNIQAVASALIQRFRDELGLDAGRLYRREGEVYILEATFGDGHEAPIGLEVSRDYPPIVDLLENGTTFKALDDPAVDREFERKIGATQFAAIEVGSEEFILAFNVEEGYDRDSVLISLGILRTSINQMLRQRKIVAIFEEARKIQASILPKRSPQVEGFDIYGRSTPMETVGGDFFDFIPLSDKILGVTIADVSGHGLPAALQVRDIFMGLRMGTERDLKIVRTVERLNQIIHHSTLTSRFVSMVYGELEANGLFIYVNAGHPAPFHIRSDGQVTALEEGGVVLGPISEATYERGFVNLEAGDLLVLFTDGILETTSTEDEEYGADRLLATVRKQGSGSSKTIVKAIFDDIAEFSGSLPQMDDRTVVVIRYLPETHRS